MSQSQSIDNGLWCIGALIFAFALTLLSSQAHAGEQAAFGFTLNTGTESSGSYADTAFADGVDHVLYENSVSPKRLDIVYHVDAIGGVNPILELTVSMATIGGGQGHDDYFIEFLVPGGSLTALGTIYASNSPASYRIAFPSGTSLAAGVDIRIKDSLQTNDKRLNQLHLDQLVVSSTDTGPPGAPSDLLASATSSSRIALLWNDTSSNETGFRIERSPTTSIGFALIASVGAGVTSWEDIGLSPSTSYYYRVQAFNVLDYSAFSNEASATTEAAPAPPDGSTVVDLAASTAGHDAIDLAWHSNTGNEEGFRIWRATSAPVNTAGVPSATAPANADSFSDTGLQPDTTHYYAIAAYNSTGVVGASNEAAATTDPAPPPAGGPATSKVIAGYYESWAIYNARKYYVQDIPFERVTHINYAFANLRPNGEVIIGDIFADITNTKDPESAINPGPDELPQGNIPQLIHMRDVGHLGRGPFPHVKLILSVGGWSWSENFTAMAATPEGRHAFAESVKQFVAGFPTEADGTVHPLGAELDGVDLDWEYPSGDINNCGEPGNGCSPDDPVNHALLLLAVRAKLDELGPGKELSMAMPAGYYLIEKVMPPIVDNSYLSGQIIMRDPVTTTEWLVGSQTAADALDYLHVMNYDMSGATYSPLARHHAQLYGYEGPSPDPQAGPPDEAQRINSHFAIQAYSYVHSNYTGFDPDNPSLDAETGVGRFPMSKLTFGMPMYGKGFKVDGSSAWDGYPLLFQPNRGIGGGNNVPKGTWDGGRWGNSGVWAYWDIFTNLGGDRPSFIGGGADPATRLHGAYVIDGANWIGFDDTVLQTAKAHYAVDNGMAGVMFWSFPGDISRSTARQGQTNAAHYPSMSLVHNLAFYLEQIAPSP